jgi:allantoinase
MQGDWILRSQRVVTSGAVRPADIAIAKGRITAVRDVGAAPVGPPVVDVGALAVLPGVVDTHVHVNEPGRTAWEGFATATAAAAAGGVTTIVDMPLNSIPATTSVRALDEKLAALGSQARIDVGLWGGAVPGNAGELVAMLRAGALGFKCFLVDSGVDEFRHVDADGLRDALAAIADTEAPLLVHAELPGPLARADAALAAAALTDPRSYLRYLRSRPPEAEDEAVALVATTAAATGGRAHIVHLSSAGALETLREARARGVRLSAETTPHYLVFAAEAIPDGATPYKCAPPIREDENRGRLWAGLADGTVEMVVTDHSPCTPELKRIGDGDLAGAWGGIASLELGLAAVWTEARARGFDLVQVVDWLCRRPAALAGLAGRKGDIVVGADADLVVLDPEATFVVDAAALHHRHPVTPYDGARLHGRVAATILRGQPVFVGAAAAGWAAPWAGAPGLVGAPRGTWLRGTAA